MPAYIAKQPNGLYCRFSTVVDTFTHYNMTEDDVRELFAEHGRAEANMALCKAQRLVNNFNELKSRFIPNNMTRKHFNMLLEEMTASIEQEAQG